MVDRLREPIPDMLDRLKRVINDIKFEKDFTNATTEIPGMPLESFTRAGLPAVWSTFRLYEKAFTYSIIEENFNLIPFRHTDGLYFVTTGGKMKIFPEFYEKMGVNCPTLFHAGPGNLGKNSYTCHFRFRHKISGAPFIEQELQICVVSRATGKVVPLPEEIRNTMVKHGNPEKFRIQHPQEPEPSTEVYTYNTRARHSDTDLNYHIASASLLKFCMDGAATSQLEGKLLAFKKDILSYPVMEVIYSVRSEVFPGDDVRIDFWQETMAKDTLCFRVWKTKDGTKQLAAIYTVKFYLPKAML